MSESTAARLHALFDVEPFRGLPRRTAVLRSVAQPTVVLGSTQRAEVIDAQRVSVAKTEVVRRRGGGGAVLLYPDDHLWLEAWIPREDPLWVADVAAAAVWVGEWWVAGLAAVGVTGCSVHHGRALPGRHGDLVCFSGRGPGEAFTGGRKIMGVSQWRGKEGALFHACTYTLWDPRPLVDLFALDEAQAAAMVADLSGSAAGLEDLGFDRSGLSHLGDALLSSFDDWGEGRPPPSP